MQEEEEEEEIYTFLLIMCFRLLVKWSWLAQRAKNE